MFGPGSHPHPNPLPEGEGAALRETGGGPQGEPVGGHSGRGGRPQGEGGPQERGAALRERGRPSLFSSPLAGLGSDHKGPGMGSPYRVRQAPISREPPPTRGQAPGESGVGGCSRERGGGGAAWFSWDLWDRGDWGWVGGLFAGWVRRRGLCPAGRGTTISRSEVIG